MQKLQFSLLGPVAVCADGRPVPIGGPRAQAVLAALLLEPDSVVSLTRLVETIWGDDAPANARFQAQNKVSALRRALREAGCDDVIRTVGSGYEITAPADGLDVIRFDALVQDGGRHLVAGELDRAASALSAALCLWRGEALAGLTSPRLAAAAHRLEEARLSARELLVETDLRRGRHNDLIPGLQELAELHPWRERLVGQLMTALYRSGRRRDALATFDRTRRRLVAELGLCPGPALVTIRDQVLRDASALTVAAHEPATLGSLTTATTRLHADVPVQAGRLGSRMAVDNLR